MGGAGGGWETKVQFGVALQWEKNFFKRFLK